MRIMNVLMCLIYKVRWESMYDKKNCTSMHVTTKANGKTMKENKLAFELPVRPIITFDNFARINCVPLISTVL